MKAMVGVGWRSTGAFFAESRGTLLDAQRDVEGPVLQLEMFPRQSASVERQGCRVADAVIHGTADGGGGGVCGCGGGSSVLFPLRLRLFLFW